MVQVVPDRVGRGDGGRDIVEGTAMNRGTLANIGALLGCILFAVLMYIMGTAARDWTP